MLKRSWLLTFKKPLWEAIIVAFLLILLVFPNVIFKGASLRLTDQLIATYYGGKELRTFYPTPPHIQWWSSYNDTGGAIFQSEPMSEFMRRTIANGDSPYWNPYSAAGSLGPETLVDQKFSPLTLISAFLGGDSLKYNFIMLILYGLGVVFMYLSMRRIFMLSPLSSVGVGIFYLLNGYAIANVGSNTTQSYLFVPICLYTILSYFIKPNAVRFFCIVPAFALMLLCTFLPTTIVSFVAIYSVAIGLLISRIKNREIKLKDAVFLLITQFIACAITILLLALLYFPIFENIASTGILNQYALRQYFPINFPNALLSLFSPSLFFESYNARELSAIEITGNTTYHFGIVAIALAGCSFTVKANRFKPLVIFYSITILFFFGHLFGVPLLSNMVRAIPVIGNIGNQYWWIAILLPLSILIGFGIQNLQDKNARTIPVVFLIFIGVIACFHINNIYGLREPNLEFKKIALICTTFLTLCVFSIILSIRFTKKKWISSLCAVLLVAGLFVELTLDGKIIRYERSDFFVDASPPIHFLQREIGLYRTINLGTTGLYPELGSAFGIQEISSLNEGGLPSFRDYFYSTFGLEPSQQFGYVQYLSRASFPSLYGVRDEPRKNIIDWEKIDLLGVKFVVLPSSFLNYRKEFLDRGFRIVHDSPYTMIFENPTVLPRAFGISFEAGDEKQNIELPKEFRTTLTPFEITNYRNARVEIRGSASKKMLVVLTDNWHNNWIAKVNGTSTPILRVNGTFRGIIIPVGNFYIDMTYQPKSLSFAFLSTGFGLLILSSILFWQRRLDLSIKSRLSFWDSNLSRLDPHSFN